MGNHVNGMLAAMPATDRLAALTCNILADEPNALKGVAALISVAAMLARLMSATQRQALAWHMAETAEALKADAMDRSLQ